MAGLIKIENVYKAFNGKEVLRNINLEIQKGEIFVLIGPSGAGKTTLLRILNFFEKPEKGNIKFTGFNASGIINIRRRMSFIFQRPTILNKSVFENMAYPLRLRGIDKKTILRKVSDVLDTVGLKGLEGQKARTLSGGEAQRMAFARAMVYDPEIFFLDEPTANLDPYNVMKIEEIIGRVRSARGTTIVLATHNLPQVRRIADRVGILINGELIEVNSREGVFSNPKDVRSRAFIDGEMIY